MRPLVAYLLSRMLVHWLRPKVMRKRYKASGRPVWAAYGGNGSVVGMDSTTTTSARHLLNILLSEVDDLCPNVPAWVLEVVCVQFIATLIELEQRPTSEQ